jgi:hypothetical protein
MMISRLLVCVCLFELHVVLSRCLWWAEPLEPWLPRRAPPSQALLEDMGSTST